MEIIGSPHEADIVDGGSYAAVRKLFSKRCPDWIAIHPMHLPELRRIVLDLYGEERAPQAAVDFPDAPNPDPEWRASPSGRTDAPKSGRPSTFSGGSSAERPGRFPILRWKAE